MSTNEELKKIVREKYGEIVSQEKEQNQSSCCSPAATTCCGPDADLTIFSEDYSNLEGYNPAADYGLGCNESLFSACRNFPAAKIQLYQPRTQ